MFILYLLSSCITSVVNSIFLIRYSVFSLNFFLLDPDPIPGGKMNMDPDPQPWHWQVTTLCWRQWRVTWLSLYTIKTIRSQDVLWEESARKTLQLFYERMNWQSAVYSSWVQHEHMNKSLKINTLSTVSITIFVLLSS